MSPTKRYQATVGHFDALDDKTMEDKRHNERNREIADLVNCLRKAKNQNGARGCTTSTTILFEVALSLQILHSSRGVNTRFDATAFLADRAMGSKYNDAEGELMYRVGQMAKISTLVMEWLRGCSVVPRLSQSGKQSEQQPDMAAEENAVERMEEEKPGAVSPIAQGAIVEPAGPTTSQAELSLLVPVFEKPIVKQEEDEAEVPESAVPALLDGVAVKVEPDSMVKEEPVDENYEIEFEVEEEEEVEIDAEEEASTSYDNQDYNDDTQRSSQRQHPQFRSDAANEKQAEVVPSQFFYACSSCCHRFQTKWGGARHFEKCGGRPVKLPAGTVVTRSLLETLLEASDNGELIAGQTCAKCDCHFTNAKTFAAHKMICDGGSYSRWMRALKRDTCMKCDSHFTSAKALAAHKTICDGCDSRWARALKREERHLLGKKTDCPKCFQGFVSAEALASHEKFCLYGDDCPRPKRARISTEAKRIPQRADLHPNIRLLCTKCRQGFKSPEAVVAHQPFCLY